MKRLLWLVGLVVPGCSAALEVPSDLRVDCTVDADCVSGRCATNVGYCVTELDHEALRVLGATAVGPSSAVINFDDTLDPATIDDPASYVIAPALEVTFATYDEANHAVILSTGEQSPGVTYVVTVSGLTDEQGNPLASDAATATFVSFFGAPDAQPPRVLAPAIDAVVRESDVLLQWTSVVAAASYSVDMSTDATFATAVQHRDIAAPATEVTLTAIGDVTYYWRVRADTTAAGTWTNARFQRLGDAIFVGCPVAGCNGGAGNISQPLASVLDGLELAQLYGITQVNVAGSSSAYDGPLIIDGSGVNFTGGYDPTFAVHDSTLYPTVVRGVGAALIVSGTTAPIVFDGFTFEATPTSSVAVVQIRNASAVELDNCLVRSSGDDTQKTDQTIGVLAENPVAAPAARLVMHDSVVELGGGADVIGIRTSAVAVDLLRLTVQPRLEAEVNHATNLDLHGYDADNGYDQPSTLDLVTLTAQTLMGTSTPSSALGSINGSVTLQHGSFHVPAAPSDFSWSGLDMSSASGVVERSFFIMENAGSDANGYALRFIPGAQLVVRDNAFIVANGIGVLSQGRRPLEDLAPRLGPSSVVDNTIMVDAGDALHSENLDLEGASAFDATDNILVAPVCLREGAVLEHPNVFANAMACPTIFVDPSAAPITDVADLNAFDGRLSNPNCSGVCLHQHATANFAVSSSGLFVTSAGPPAGRDVHLAASAPAAVRQSDVDTTQSVCGFTDQVLACAGDATDLDDKPRGPARSCGAFEY